MSLASVDPSSELEVELDVLGVATVLVETVLDVATVLVVTVLVVAVLEVAVVAGTVIIELVDVLVDVTGGAATITGAALQLLIVNDPQSLSNKFLIRPNSL